MRGRSPNRATFLADLNGYFFNITATELLTAPSLRERYRFLFVNTLTGEHQKMSPGEVSDRAVAMYSASHIRF